MSIINQLRELKPILKEKYGIEELAVFGSYARGEESENSDIDLAITKIKEKNYFKRAQATYFLENHFKKKIDLGYFDSMRNILQSKIKQEMIYV